MHNLVVIQQTCKGSTLLIICVWAGERHSKMQQMSSSLSFPCLLDSHWSPLSMHSFSQQGMGGELASAFWLHPHFQGILVNFLADVQLANWNCNQPSKAVGFLTCFQLHSPHYTGKATICAPMIVTPIPMCGFSNTIKMSPSQVSVTPSGCPAIVRCSDYLEMASEPIG